MLICHIAPFAPNRCGLYEAARDMARADIYGGNDVIFVDAGITVDGNREPSQVGAVDNRGDFNLQTVDNSLIDKSDIIIMHTGVSDSWLVKNQIPLIWVVHGRPLACFRPERMDKSTSYSLYQNIAQWDRTKYMLYFWKEFKPHWSPIFNNKDLIVDYPVIDENRFNNASEIHYFANKGEYNILICDSEREDIDLYEMVVGILEIARIHKNVKFHFTSVDIPLKNCWNILLGELQKLGCLGDVSGRLGDMEKVYNACDCLMSPNRIITRTIGEALSCGIPVISQNNDFNMVSDYTCDMSNPKDILEAFNLFMSDKKKGLIKKEDIKERSKVFSLKNYSDRMNLIYKSLK